MCDLCPAGDPCAGGRFYGGGDSAVLAPARRKEEETSSHPVRPHSEISTPSTTQTGGLHLNSQRVLNWCSHSFYNMFISNGNIYNYKKT